MCTGSLPKPSGDEALDLGAEGLLAAADRGDVVERELLEPARGPHVLPVDRLLGGVRVTARLGLEHLADAVRGLLLAAHGDARERVVDGAEVAAARDVDAEREVLD